MLTLGSFSLNILVTFYVRRIRFYSYFIANKYSVWLIHWFQRHCDGRNEQDFKKTTVLEIFEISKKNLEPITATC